MEEELILELFDDINCNKILEILARCCGKGKKARIHDVRGAFFEKKPFIKWLEIEKRGFLHKVIGLPDGGVSQKGGIGPSLPLNHEEADGSTTQGSDSVNLLLYKLKNRKIGKPTKKLSMGLALKQKMKKLKSKGGLKRKQKSTRYKSVILLSSLMADDGTSVPASFKERESLSASTNPEFVEAL
ncbi:hypothetical protein Ancab_028821 [Ancistrocladus abbreviatus]